MKRSAAAIVISLALTVPVAAYSMEHDGHGSMEMGHSGHKTDITKVAYQGVVDGVKVTFKIMDMGAHAKAMNTELPKGMKETYHFMVEFKDSATGKTLREGKVRVKVTGPVKTDQIKDLMAMEGMAGMEAGFGAGFDLSQKGKYGIMSKFILKDGKPRSCKFWYEVK
jgi:hypothetical protein